MSWLQELALALVSALLQKLIKNPGSVQVEIHVLQQIRDDAAVVCLAIDPTIAPPPGYVAATTTPPIPVTPAAVEPAAPTA